MKNPFCPVAEFPDFPAMTPEAADEALPKLLAGAKASVDALEKRATPTWDGFVRALDAAEDVDKAYLEQVLPEKMRYNLDSIRDFSFTGEIKTMFRTVAAVLGKDYQ